MDKTAKYHVTFLNRSKNNETFYSYQTYTVTDNTDSNKPIELRRSTIEEMIANNLENIQHATWCSVVGLVKISETVEKRPRFSQEVKKELYFIFIFLLILINTGFTFYRYFLAAF